MIIWRVVYVLTCSAMFNQGACWDNRDEEDQGQEALVGDLHHGFGCAAAEDHFHSVFWMMKIKLVDSGGFCSCSWFCCVWAIGLCNYSSQDAVGYFFFFFSEVSSETMSYIGTEFTLSTCVDSVFVDVVVVDSSLVLDAVEDFWRFSWRCCWWTVDSTS